ERSARAVAPSETSSRLARTVSGGSVPRSVSARAGAATVATPRARTMAGMARMSGALVEEGGDQEAAQHDRVGARGAGRGDEGGVAERAAVIDEDLAVGGGQDVGRRIVEPEVGGVEVVERDEADPRDARRGADQIVAGRREVVAVELAGAEQRRGGGGCEV